MNKSPGIVACAIVLWFFPPAAEGSQVVGRVRAKGRPERANVTTLVYAESQEGRTPVVPGRYRMFQRNKTFVPHVLAVPVGSTVDFPNEDLIFHNVFARSYPDPFDLGLYRSGVSRSRVFSRPAVYRIFCNIHPPMAAVILVLPTSFITEADSNGGYRLDLPPGRYRITAWSEKSEPVATEIAVSGGPVNVSELTLDETGYAPLPHKNKYGQDYPKTAYDPLRSK